MSTDKEIEKLLGSARVTTTPEQDKRLLAGAAAALPRPGRIRRLLPRFLAAAVLIGIVLGGFTARGIRDDQEENPLDVAGSIEVPNDAVIALNFNRRPHDGDDVTVRFHSSADANPVRIKSLFPMKIDEILTVSGGTEGGVGRGSLAAGTGRTGFYFGTHVDLPGVGGSRGAKRTFDTFDRLTVNPDPATEEKLRAAFAKVYRVHARERKVSAELLPEVRDSSVAAKRSPEEVWNAIDRALFFGGTQFGLTTLESGVDVRGLGGDKGVVVNLDDVTNGLDDDSREAFENEWRRRYGDATSIGREEYDRIPEKPFLDPRRAPLSTFGIDVDTASYANVRRFLMSGQLPPPDAVRIEEMVNYFAYDYPQPEGDAPFSVITEVATCPWNPGHRLVHIGIQGKTIERGEIPPRNLVFLLDVSGSMSGADKLPLVKSAMKLLVGELGRADHVSIVTYAGTSGVALEPTNCADRPAVLGAIEALHAGGSTNAGSGIQLAYEMARRNYRKDSINRVILATDGDFNVGITDRQSLEALITGERDGGVFLTVLGVGTGNLKDSQLEMLADKGNGNYAYLDSILEAQKVLVREAGATMVTIAKDVKIQVEFNPHHVGAYRLIGYENRMLSARDFNDDRKDAGEIGAGHSVTALYEIAPPGEQPDRPEVDPLRYQETPPAAPARVKEEHSDEIFALKLRYKRPDADESSLLTYARTDPGPVPVARASETFSFASAVATFGMLLRRSEAAKDISFALVSEIAAGAIGEDPEGDRAEFLKLVKIAAGLAK